MCTQNKYDALTWLIKAFLSFCSDVNNFLQSQTNFRGNKECLEHYEIGKLLPSLKIT